MCYLVPVRQKYSTEQSGTGLHCHFQVLYILNKPGSLKFSKKQRVTMKVT